MIRGLEYYATPEPFTTWLFAEMAHQGVPIVGRLFEPCVGDGAIIRAAGLRPMEFGVDNTWITNDLDSRWLADFHFDAADAWLPHLAFDAIDWTVTNPPFTLAIQILERALVHSRVGVAMHLRASIHEVLKRGVRRHWMADNLPTGILWLPRFAYQRSPTTGKWTTDSVCACWVIWVKPGALGERRQFFKYAPISVIDQLDALTPTYRRSMDAMMAGVVLPSVDPRLLT